MDTLYDVLSKDKELLDIIERQSIYIHRISENVQMERILDVYKDIPTIINALIVTKEYSGMYNEVTAYIPVIPKVYCTSDYTLEYYNKYNLQNRLYRFCLPIMYRILMVLIQYYRDIGGDLLLISDGSDIDILVSVDLRYNNQLVINSIRDYNKLPDNIEQILNSRLNLLDPAVQ